MQCKPIYRFCLGTTWFSLLHLATFCQTLILNEISNGANGNKEYVEFVVVDSTATYDCSGNEPPCIDIRGWIFDDNSGYHGSGGIAQGALRFSNDPLWSCLPLGTIILLYNDADPGLLIPPDDITLNDNNCRLVVPISNQQLIERNNATPGAVACSYPTTGWLPGGDWSFTFLANSGDCARVVDLSGCEVFSVCWAACNDNNQIYFDSGGSGSQNVWFFNDGNPALQANWSEGSATAGNETPGLPNNPDNASFIAQFNNECLPIPPLTVIAVGTDSDCGGCNGSATVAPVGSIPGYTLEWVDNLYNPIGETNLTATGLCEGIYHVIVSSSIGCNDTASVTIGSTGGGTTVTENVEVCLNTVYTYPDGVTHLVISDTSHTSVFTLGIGCDSTIVTDIVATTGFNVVEDTAICEGSEIQFPDGSIYEITSDTMHVSNLISVSGCDSTVTTNVTSISSISVQESVQVCSGSDYVFPDGTTQTITGNIAYTSLLLSMNGCDSTIVTTVNTLATNIIRETVVLCVGAEYTFPDGVLLQDIQRDTLHISSFTNNVGCDSIIQTTVNLQDQGLSPTFEFTPNKPSQEENEVQFATNATGDLNWTVSDTSGTLLFSSSETGFTYTFPYDTLFSHVICLEVQRNGCIGLYCDTVLLLSNPTIYIPNSFTPHESGQENGVNDVWLPIIGGGQPYKYTLEIFNRWGEKLFTTAEPDQGWDGQFKGRLVQRGVYAYRLIFSIMPYTFVYRYEGHINLVK